jgi:hypothetical protein
MGVAPGVPIYEMRHFPAISVDFSPFLGYTV